MSLIGPVHGHGVAWWDRPGAAPLAATRRDPGRYSEGAQVGVMARALGTPFLPWQQYAADVIGERRPDGEYEYQVVVVSVPRQSGKTTLLRAIGAHRCLVNGRDVFYTAQTGKDARARWGDLVTQVEQSEALRGAVQVRRAAGQERAIFPGGAAFQVFAPTPESLHGYTPPTVMLDEAFAHGEREGELLSGAIGPAQLTIVDRQLLIVSTMGTAESVFLNAWLQRAMAGTPRVAVLLWAATADQDPFARDTIEAIHPAVGFVINGKRLTVDHVLDEAANNSRAEYERAYLNRQTMTRSHTIPGELWNPLHVDAPAPPTARLVLTYDVAHSGVGGTIVATWRHQGKPHAKVVMAAAGQSWLPGAVVDLAQRWRPLAVAAHDRPPVREVTDRIERAGVTVTKVGGVDWPTACGAQLAAIRNGTFSHDGSPQLAAAFGGIAVVPDGDGERFSRRLSVGDCSGAFATTVGVWVLNHAPAPRATTPVVRVGA